MPAAVTPSGSRPDNHLTEFKDAITENRMVDSYLVRVPGPRDVARFNVRQVESGLSLQLD
jgi:hypothetical protein